MKLNKELLKAKGWSVDELEKAESVLKKFNYHIGHYDKTLYWFILIVMIFLTAILSFWLIPIFIIVEEVFAYIIVFIVGITLGVLFNNVIMHLHHIEKKHHLIANLTIPIVAIATFIIMLRSSQYLQCVLGFSIEQSEFQIIFFFILGFLLPYFYSLYTTYKR